ncbi:putative phage tail protein [Grimontia sp. NTOU-MAR1]|uniref:putative phage tail protein n=1 Tax=Grimontia sp. NTOU-MAR1 TaxID=3111011 RepID=UPI002DBB0C55|nr:putative phage tail protein [Grimontia sp. NTOU-MAR1]WRV98583.1 putative phage tail protein [Grimontia sp. NTOU-MAR1]
MDRVTRAQSTDAWLDVLQQLMPQGIAWPRDLDANQTRLLRALATSLADIDALTDALQQETTPEQSRLLLGEYEQYLGLPECSEQPLSLMERQAIAVEKDLRKGRLQAWNIEQRAKDLGFRITVKEHFPHHCLRGCTYPLYEEKYRHLLRVIVHDIPEAEGNQLECTLTQFKLGGKYYEFIYKGSD